MNLDSVLLLAISLTEQQAINASGKETNLMTMKDCFSVNLELERP